MATARGASTWAKGASTESAAPISTTSSRSGTPDEKAVMPWGMTASWDNIRPGSSGCGEDDDPAAVGVAGAIAIEQRCQLRVGVGHGGFFAAVGGATLAQAGTILRPAAANLPNRMFDAGGQPRASPDARQVQIIISDDSSEEGRLGKERV